MRLNVALKQPESSSSQRKYLHVLLALDSLVTRSSSLLASHDLGHQVARDSIGALLEGGGGVGQREAFFSRSQTVSR